MKKTFVSAAQLEQIAAQYPTPFHIYDEQGIRENARRLNAAFSWNPGFSRVFRGESDAYACNYEGSAGGGVRMRLFIAYGADDGRTHRLCR